MRLPDLGTKDVTFTGLEFHVVLTEEKTFPFQYQNRKLSVKVVGVYWKGHPGVEIEVDDFEEWGVFDQEKAFHLARGELVGVV